MLLNEQVDENLSKKNQENLNLKVNNQNVKIALNQPIFIFSQNIIHSKITIVCYFTVLFYFKFMFYKLIIAEIYTLFN